jgi:hypothetical protein
MEDKEQKSESLAADRENKNTILRRTIPRSISFLIDASSRSGRHRVASRVAVPVAASGQPRQDRLSSFVAHHKSRYFTKVLSTLNHKLWLVRHRHLHIGLIHPVLLGIESVNETATQ